MKLLGALVLAVTLAACSSTSTDESEPDVTWSEYGPGVQRRIDKATEAGNCRALQDEFDAADKNDDRHRAQFGTGNADLLDYLDAAMSDAGCY